MTTTHHDIRIAAPAQVVFDIIANVESWPLRFPPTIKAQRVDGDEQSETIRIWAMAEGRVRSWQSDRTLDREHLTVTFRQTVPASPLTSMIGRWTIVPAQDDVLVRFSHEFTVEGDDPATIARVVEAIDINTTSELGSLKDAAESSGGSDLAMDFADTIDLPVGDSGDAREFIERCDLWPERLDHVESLHLAQNDAGLQVMEMETRSTDGSMHTTVSGRVCDPGGTIAYKQTRTPEGLTAHCGEWSFSETPDGVRVTSRHMVLLDGDVLDRRGLSTEEARTMVRNALGTNSRATLNALSDHLQLTDK